MHKILVFAALAVLGQATVTASTTDTLEPRTRRVSLAGLDLAHPAGVAVAYRRIRLASEAVCQNLSPRDLSQRKLWQECISQAIARAVADVNAPALTAYSSDKTRDRKAVTTVASR
jgi:UrcA family protein